MSEINSVKDAQKFVKTAEVGASWFFGGFPDPITEEDPDEYDKIMAKAVALEGRIAAIIDRGVVKEDKQTKRTITTKAAKAAGKS